MFKKIIVPISNELIEKDMGLAKKELKALMETINKGNPPRRDNHIVSFSGG